MNKCLRITVQVKITDAYIKYLQEQARAMGLEGTLKAHSLASALGKKTGTGGELQIAICGPKDTVDQFLDAVHKGTRGTIPTLVQIEPFIKEKDYRGVFRIIE